MPATNQRRAMAGSSNVSRSLRAAVIHKLVARIPNTASAVGLSLYPVRKNRGAKATPTDTPKSSALRWKAPYRLPVYHVCFCRSNR